jgi:hypothetical protein
MRHYRQPAFAVLRFGLASWILALWAPAGLAQDADSVIVDESAVREHELRLSQQSPRALIDNAVIQRLRPGYDALGITVGGFRVYPKLDVQLAYDTNIFETPTKEPDEEVIVAPSVAVRSNWERHSLGLDASTTIERFARHPSEDIENYDVALNGVLDLGLGGHLHGLARAAQDIEDRGSIGDLFPGGEPIRYRKRQASGGLEEHLAGMFFSLDGDFASYRYDDVRYQGVTFAQNYRDRDEARVTGQVALRIAPRMAFFTEISANTAQYQSRTIATDFSSRGESVIAGITFQVPALLSGEIGVGYIRQTYDTLPLGQVSGPTFDLSTLWNITPLWTLTASAHRSIQQTPFPQAPSIIESQFALKLDYELLRNLLLNAQGTFTLDDFGARYRVDQRLNATFGARYLMSRTLSTNLSVAWSHQNARSNFLRPYQGLSVRVGLTAQR